MWEEQAISSSKGVCITWRQVSGSHAIDNADSWFSLRYCPAYNEMLWKRNVQAVRMAEVKAMSSALKLCMLCRPMSARHLFRGARPELPSN